MKIIRSFALGTIASALIAVGSAAYAAPLANGTKLTIAPGVGSGANQQCTSGSCWGVEANPGDWVWTNIAPGTDLALVIGKNQKSGGQELASSSANSTSGDLTAAWGYFRNYGTFATAPLTGWVGANLTTDASKNIFDNASCSMAGCLGKTQLGTWHAAWNGGAYALGSDGGCQSGNCLPDHLAGIGVTSWVVNPDQSYQLDYNWTSPYSNPVVPGFKDGHFQLHLEGTIVPTTWPDISGTWLSTDGRILFIFGDRFGATPQDNQLTINGVSVTSVQVVDTRLLLVLLPPGLTSPFTVCVTTPGGTVCFPKPCAP